MEVGLESEEEEWMGVGLAVGVFGIDLVGEVESRGHQSKSYKSQ